MKKELFDKIAYELKCFFSEEDYEELMKKGFVELKKFIEKPEVKKIILRVTGPLIMIWMVAKVGVYEIKVPILNIYLKD